MIYTICPDERALLSTHFVAPPCLLIYSSFPSPLFLSSRCLSYRSHHTSTVSARATSEPLLPPSIPRSFLLSLPRSHDLHASGDEDDDAAPTR
ncbi:hypothetical protein BDA96_10G074000 [Sorghum bicolor]|uniref:Uncharacterized protein n=1 Tax=Sorghum bicolor TaxID=4558 RepID=A0A921Q1B1_SORBI|nr:hypothetical protein BDA96_10G074000 [Sorghum bicolor]